MAQKCNLKADHVTGVWSGVAGNETTIQITNTDGGAATFKVVSYDDNVIATDTSSVTFTIVAGNASLTYVYEGSAPGDQIKIVDPCGKELDAFPCDPGNFQKTKTVVGAHAAPAGAMKEGEE